MKTDLEIQKGIIEELNWEPSINASDINVSVKNGVVTLSGKVESYFKKEKAEKIAKSVEGVVKVFENIDVKAPSETKKTDMEIEQLVLNELKWNTSVRADRVKIEVKNGVVALNGEVEWEFQRIEIRDTIKKLSGVKSIVNNVKIVPTSVASEIKQKIQSSAQRKSAMEEEKINIEGSSKKRTRAGRAKSWMDKNETENPVWPSTGA
jgi:osmotically-inducible protein OsmY